MITASIVIYKTSQRELSTVLSCLAKSQVDTIYLVDNSPNDDLRSSVNTANKVEYIYGQGNVGYGTGHNIAIRKSISLSAQYHVVINPDIEFDQGVIESLSQYMDNNTEVGQVMPKIVYPNGELQYLCKLLPTPMDLIGRRFVPIKSHLTKRYYCFEMRGSGYDKEMAVPFLSGCFMFLRVEALAKVNGFDDKFFMYCEDIDLCRRISMAGYKTMYYPSVSVIHAHKKESFKSNTMLKAHIKSAVRYFNKWGWFFDNYRIQTNKKARKQYE